MYKNMFVCCFGFGSVFFLFVLFVCLFQAKVKALKVFSVGCSFHFFFANSAKCL